jgi:hypothetical protein
MAGDVAHRNRRNRLRKATAVIKQSQRDRCHGWRGAGNAHQLGGCGRPQVACRNVRGVPELSRRSTHTLKEVEDVANRPEILTPLPLLRPLELPSLPFCSRFCALLSCRRSHFVPSCAAAAPNLLPLLRPLLLPPRPLLRVACLLDSRGNALPGISTWKQHGGNGSSYST